MTNNRYQRGEDIQFYLDPSKIEGYTAETDIRIVLCPNNIDLNKESSKDKIVVLTPVSDGENLVFMATHEITSTMAVGDYDLEMVYTIGTHRSICKSYNAFSLEDSASNYINTASDED